MYIDLHGDPYQGQIIFECRQVLPSDCTGVIISSARGKIRASQEKLNEKKADEITPEGSNLDIFMYVTVPNGCDLIVIYWRKVFDLRSFFRLSWLFLLHNAPLCPNRLSQIADDRR